MWEQNQCKTGWVQHREAAHNPECNQILNGEDNAFWVGDICEDTHVGEEKTKKREGNGKINYICIFIILQLSISKVLSSSYFSWSSSKSILFQGYSDVLT